jgi:hypothetical protein
MRIKFTKMLNAQPSSSTILPARSGFGQLKPILVLAGITLHAGCSSFGPDALRGTHPLYNDAIVASMNEQFIQNLVRLRYRDPPFFLDVASVTASLKLDLSAGIDQSEIGLNGGSDILKYSFGTAYSTQPTISYAPLQGEAFVKSVLSPIPLATLFTLAESGWSLQRVFGICVERINGIENMPSASGPTPSINYDDYHRFDRLMRLTGQIQRTRLIVPQIHPVTNEPVLLVRSSPEHRDQIREIKDLLGLSQDRESYRVNGEFFHSGPDMVSIRTRSLMSIFFYLSQNVDAPISDEQDSLVTRTRNEDGSLFNWAATPAGRLFHVYESENRPEKAFLAIPYRDHWFYLADNDLESKSSFMLLMQLFRLQAGATKATGPTLTIPVR